MIPEATPPKMTYLSAASLDFAIVDLVARQHEADDAHHLERQVDHEQVAAHRHQSMPERETMSSSVKNSPVAALRLGARRASLRRASREEDHDRGDGREEDAEEVREPIEREEAAEEHCGSVRRATR